MAGATRDLEVAAMKGENRPKNVDSHRSGAKNQGGSVTQKNAATTWAIIRIAKERRAVTVGYSKIT